MKRFLEAGGAALKAGGNESAIVTMRPSLAGNQQGQPQSVEYLVILLLPEL